MHNGTYIVHTTIAYYIIQHNLSQSNRIQLLNGKNHASCFVIFAHPRSIPRCLRATRSWRLLGKHRREFDAHKSATCQHRHWFSWLFSSLSVCLIQLNPIDQSSSCYFSWCPHGSNHGWDMVSPKLPSLASLGGTGAGSCRKPMDLMDLKLVLAATQPGHPSEKHESQLGWNSQYMEKKNVPNHEPETCFWGVCGMSPFEVYEKSCALSRWANCLSNKHHGCPNETSTHGSDMVNLWESTKM